MSDAILSGLEHQDGTGGHDIGADEAMVGAVRKRCTGTPLLHWRQCYDNWEVRLAM